MMKQKIEMVQNIYNKFFIIFRWIAFESTIFLLCLFCFVVVFFLFFFFLSLFLLHCLIAGLLAWLLAYLHNCWILILFIPQNQQLNVFLKPNLVINIFIFRIWKWLHTQLMEWNFLTQIHYTSPCGINLYHTLGFKKKWL